MTANWIDREGLRRAWKRVRPLLWNPPRWWAAIKRNMLLKIVSVLAALSLWLFVNAGAREIQIALQVPVELRNIPSHLMIISPRVDFVDLLVSGPRTILGRIDRGRLVFPVDLNGVRPGPAVFRVGAESFDLPRGTKITRINPSQITLELARVGRKSVPVRLDLEGEPPDGLVVGATTVAPRSVEVVGPAPDIANIKGIDTEPVRITGTQPGREQTEVALVSPGDYFSLSAQRVAVEIQLEDQIVTREIRHSIQVTDSAYSATVRPKEVRLVLRGPKRTLEALELPDGAVYIDAASENPGVHMVTPTVDVPRGVEVVSQTPERVRLELKKERARK